MRGKSWDRFRVHVLTTPAVIWPWWLGERRVATRATPSRDLVGVLILLFFFDLVGVPFLDAVEMSDGPAG